MYPPFISASSFEEDETETGSNSSDSYNWQYPTSSVKNRRHTTRTTLPQILLPPDDIVDKYNKLKNPSTMACLLVKLAQEFFFELDMMGKSTVAGQRGLAGLPEAQLYNLKLQLFPMLNRAEFEDK